MAQNDGQTLTVMGIQSYHYIFTLLQIHDNYHYLFRVWGDGSGSGHSGHASSAQARRESSAQASARPKMTVSTASTTSGMPERTDLAAAT